MLLLSKGGALHAKDSHGATPLSLVAGNPIAQPNPMALTLTLQPSPKPYSPRPHPSHSPSLSPSPSPGPKPRRSISSQPAATEPSTSSYSSG